MFHCSIRPFTIHYTKSKRREGLTLRFPSTDAPVEGNGPGWWLNHFFVVIRSLSPLLGGNAHDGVARCIRAENSEGLQPRHQTLASERLLLRTERVAWRGGSFTKTSKCWIRLADVRRIGTGFGDRQRSTLNCFMPFFTNGGDGFLPPYGKSPSEVFNNIVKLIIRRHRFATRVRHEDCRGR